MYLSIPKFASAWRGRSSKDFWLISASFRRYRGMPHERVISGDNYIRGERREFHVPGAGISKERLSDVFGRSFGLLGGSPPTGPAL
jgi:hypothetical protein